MYSANTGGAANNIDGGKAVHRRANRRLMIGALSVLFLAVIAAIAGVIIFLARKEDSPRSTSQQFSPIFDIQFSINETWNPNYGDKSSAEFIQLSTRLLNELDSIFRAAMYSAGEQYNYTEIISFRNGSVVTKCRSYWKSNSHTEKNKNTITTTPIDDVFVYQTLFDGAQKAEDNPVSSPLLSQLIDGSITVTETDTESSTTISATSDSTQKPSTSTQVIQTTKATTIAQTTKTLTTSTAQTTTTRASTTTQTTETTRLTTTSAAQRVQGINIPDQNVMIKYTLDQNHGIYFSDFMNISVRFSTVYNYGFLFWIKDETTTDHVSMDINNSGGVRFTADAKFERIEVNTPNLGYSYTDGQEHIVRMWRTGSDANQLHLKVDNDQEALLSVQQPSILSRNPILTKPKYMYIGKNETSQSGFRGCISHIEIDAVNPLIEIYRVPRPSFIDVTPNNTLLRNNVCGYDDVPVENVCLNETLLAQHALPCLAQNISDALAASSQTVFCSVLEDIADCIVKRIFNDTKVQCTDDDKYNAVRKYQTELTQVFTVYNVQYQIEPCLPS